MTLTADSKGLRGGPETLGNAVILTAKPTRRELGVQWAALAREVSATLVSLASLCHGKVKILVLYLNIYKLIPKRAPVCHPTPKKAK